MIYHSGELAIQEKAGTRDFSERVSKIVTNTIVPGAIAFIENQNMVVLSSADQSDDIWVSLIIGNNGFVQVPDVSSILFDRKMIKSDQDDVLFENLTFNANIGGVFIELGSRRRFRVNGRVSLEEANFKLVVEEAYGNCPKYIQRRVIEHGDSSNDNKVSTSKGTGLSQELVNWISQADTFFVGSQGENGKLDVNHRGGNNGFVEVIEGNRLKIPDYVGNNMFNTLGNIYQNGKAGLLFIDFKKGRTLQLSGKAELLFDQTTSLDFKKTTETGRYWLFDSQQWIITEHHHQEGWGLPEYSPFNREII